jgi:hypothetical protein
VPVMFMFFAKRPSEAQQEEHGARAPLTEAHT